jgi:hypothetical protein
VFVPFVHILAGAVIAAILALLLIVMFNMFLPKD